MLQGFLRLNSDTFRENSSELGDTRLAWRLRITKIIRETTDAFNWNGFHKTQLAEKFCFTKEVQEALVSCKLYVGLNWMFYIHIRRSCTDSGNSIEEKSREGNNSNLMYHIIATLVEAMGQNV